MKLARVGLVGCASVALLACGAEGEVFTDDRGAVPDGLGAWAGKFGDVVGEIDGVRAYSNGPTHDINGPYRTFGWQYQCVELVNRYLFEARGLANLRGSGDAKHYWSRDLGLERHANGSGCPRHGDVLVSTAGPHGHVGVVDTVSAAQVVVVQQNWTNGPADGAFPLTLVRNGANCTVGAFGGGSYTVAGWLRAPGGPPGAPSLAAAASDGSGTVTLAATPAPGTSRLHFQVCSGSSLNDDCLDDGTGMVGFEPEPGVTSVGVDLVEGSWCWSARGIAAGDVGGWGPYAPVQCFDVTTTASPPVGIVRAWPPVGEAKLVWAWTADGATGWSAAQNWDGVPCAPAPDGGVVCDPGVAPQGYPELVFNVIAGNRWACEQVDGPPAFEVSVAGAGLVQIANGQGGCNLLATPD